MLIAIGMLLLIFVGCGKDKEEQIEDKQSEEQAIESQEKTTADSPKEIIGDEQTKKEESEEQAVQAQEKVAPDIPKEATDEVTSKDGAPMALIPAGEFQMGTELSEIPQLLRRAKEWHPESDPGLFENEMPRHTVYLDAFHIDKYEVTNALYGKFMDAASHRTPKFWDDPRFNAPDQPVVGVSWYDAKAYAEWAGKRLPTEAEWEKAAQGGLIGKRFPWGDSDIDGTQCNFKDKSWLDKNADDGYKYTAPVGSFIPNGYGLYDMAGNAVEWCADRYDEYYYAKSPKRNPAGPDSGVSRIIRGGGWFDLPYFIRSAGRTNKNPLDMDSRIGFRCVAQEGSD